MKKLFNIIFILALAGCGGGGDESKEDVAENNTVKFKIQLEEGASTVTTISSGAFQDISLQGQTIEIDGEAIEAFVSAYDANEQIVFLGITDPENTEIEIGAKSTVKALLLLVPDVTVAEGASPGTYEGSIATLPSVTDLVEYISLNPDWSLPTTEFSNLYQLAIHSAISALSSQNDASDRSTRMITIDNRLSDGVDLAYELEKSGINVKVNSSGREAYPGLKDTFTVELTNGFKRWAIAFIGEDPSKKEGDLDINYENTFLLKGGGDPLKSPPLSLSVFDNESLDRYGVHVYGPAFTDLSDVPQNGQAETAYWLASIYTLIFEVGVPTLGKVTGAKNCVKEMFDPNGGAKSTASSLATSKTFRDAIGARNYSIAASEVAIAMASAISSAGLSCLSEAGIELLIKMKPIIGQAKIAIDIADTAIDTAKLGVELFQGSSQAYWSLRNLLNQGFNVEGKDYISLPLSAYGGVHYHFPAELEALDSKWKDLYTGSCENEKDPEGLIPEDVTCEAYTFDGDGPYKFVFKLTCKDPVTNEGIPCVKAVLDDTDYPANEDGVVEFTQEISEPGEYEKIDVTLHDEDGGKSVHYLYLQVKQAQPQLFPYIDSQLVASTVTDGVRAVDEAVKIALTGDETEVTETIVVRNEGIGVAIIESISVPTISGVEFDFKDASFPMQVAPSEHIEIEMTVDLDILDTESYENLDIKIKGQIGGESIAFGEIDRSPKHGDYSKLDIELSLPEAFEISSPKPNQVISSSTFDLAFSSVLPSFDASKVKLSIEGQTIGCDNYDAYNDSIRLECLDGFFENNSIAHISTLSNGAYVLKAEYEHKGQIYTSEVEFEKSCDSISITSASFCGDDSSAGARVYHDNSGYPTSRSSPNFYYALTFIEDDDNGTKYIYTPTTKVNFRVMSDRVGSYSDDSGSYFAFGIASSSNCRWGHIPNKQQISVYVNNSCSWSGETTVTAGE